jgi:trimeric autotransporter adhesin
MIKKILLLLFIVLGFVSNAQVGINTTAPKAQLEIKSSNETTPANTDGLLIPKINAFPAINPTVDQQGMLVYLTTTVGTNTPGFYYWNNSNTTWTPIKGTDTGTLDQAYDFGGAGNGRTITADTGAVLINGTDGLVSTGTSGSGALSPTGSGTRMVWNPRKAAFRVGTVSGTLWDDASIGNGSVAFGNSIAIGGNSFAAAGGNASGTSSIAYGLSATATGQSSFAFGQGASVSGGSQDAIAMGINSQASAVRAIALGASNVASGFGSLAIGSSNTSSGSQAVALGNLNTAAGTNSMALGTNNTSSSFGETVLGIGATTYTPSVNGATQFRTANGTDRVFVVGNAIDVNNNNTVDLAERSDAMVVLKNGNVGVGISTPQNKLHFHNPTGFETFMQLTNATTGSTATDGIILGNTVASGEAAIVNQEDTNLYFYSGLGGAGQLTVGKNGNVGIGNFDSLSLPQDKLHVEGNIRMVDGNQASGRVLMSDVNGTASWANISAATAGTLDESYDFGGAGAGRTIIADTGAVTIAGTDGLVSTGTLGSGALAPSGAGTRMVWNPRKAAFRLGQVSGTTWDDTNIGSFSTAFGNNTIASGIFSTALGFGSIASGDRSIASGFNSTSSGIQSTAIGHVNVASGDYSSVFGLINTAPSFGETVIGLGATTYTPSTNGATQFKIANAMDRLFVIGNAIDANNTGNIETAERSDAMVVLKNGNTGIGVSAPGERLHVGGRSLFTNGFSSDNAALIYRNNTDYMFLGPQSGSSADGGAMALFGSTNVSGGNAGGVDFNVPNAQVRMNHTNGSYAFKANSTSGYAATFELNDTGLEIGHNSASRALIFSPNSAERMRITPTGNVGIGTTPARKFHVSNGTSGGTSNANAGFVLESSTIVYQHFLTPSANESGLLFGSNLASINGGIIFNNSLATNGIQFRAGGNANRMTITSAGDVGIGVTAPGGQLELSLDEGRKPGTGTWTLSSDKRLKTINGNYTKGLNEILQLNPILFNYKNNGEHKFEQKVLDTEFPGFIAQEVQLIFPDAVGSDADGFLNFNIHPILIAYVNAFKELDIKTKELQQENKVLNEKLNLQEKSISNLLERLEKLEAKN